MSAALKTKPPLSVTIVRWGVFIFGGINLWQARAIGDQARLLLTFDPSVDPRLRAAFAFGWAVWFCIIGLALWQRRPFTRLAIPISLLLFTFYHLALLAAAVSPFARGGWSGNLIIGILAAGYSYWGLNRSSAAHYWQEK